MQAQEESEKAAWGGYLAIFRRLLSGESRIRHRLKVDYTDLFGLSNAMRARNRLHTSPSSQNIRHPSHKFCFLCRWQQTLYRDDRGCSLQL